MAEPPPAGWHELMSVLGHWRRAAPAPGTRGALILMCGAPVVAAFRTHGGGGGQLVPPPEGGGSYRQVGVHVTNSRNGGWRLLEDGEEVSSGEIEVAP